MIEDQVIGALIAARDYFRQMQNDGTTYGYYPGGDPRDFSPDGECCTKAELSAHKEACAAWDRGERPKHEAHHHKLVAADGDRTVIASYAGAFSMGVYSIRDEDADDVLDQIEAALATLGHDDSCRIG